MPRSSRIAFWLALLPLLAFPALLSTSTSAKGVRRPAASKAQKQPPEAPQPPLPQELPPVAPMVTYRGGLLTITAQNSTLSDILTAVRKATGATVDAPASASERVATRLGPAPPRDVLTALLNGSRFDYILLSTPDDPGGVRSLILRARSGEGFTASAGGGVPGGTVSLPAAARPAPARTMPPDTSEDDNAAPEPTVEPAEEAPPEPQPQIAPPQPPDVKSPEQLQEEMRRQQEELQRQQQQQQQQEQPPQ